MMYNRRLDGRMLFSAHFPHLLIPRPLPPSWHLHTTPRRSSVKLCPRASPPRTSHECVPPAASFLLLFQCSGARGASSRRPPSSRPPPVKPLLRPATPTSTPVWGRTRNPTLSHAQLQHGRPAQPPSLLCSSMKEHLGP